MKVFITGANGFVGRALVNTLKKKNISFTEGNRSLYGNICEQSSWGNFLAGHEVVVHLAARVHVMDEKSADPLTEFRKMNVEATFNIAKGAKESGVKKFIFISSIKVNGEETSAIPFKESDVPSPLDPYGVSKMEAENALMTLHEKGVFDVIVIRPPLIYGKGVKANFEKLFWLVKKDLPLPFGSVENKRSLVSVLNLCDFIVKCVEHPKAAGEVFMISDDHDYSLRELLEFMGKTLGKYPHLLPVPVRLMKFVASLIGKKAFATRLFGNLHVDVTKAKTLLDWHPPYSFEETFSA